MPVPRPVAFVACLLLGAAACGFAAAVETAEPPAPLKRLLLVSVTRGFRHSSIPVAEAEIEALGRGQARFHLDVLRGSVEQGKEPDEELKARFAKAFAPETLAAFDGVIFASTTGELPIPNLDGFLDWIRSGKAFIGFHAASDTLKSSDAYCEMIGGHFEGHPWNAPQEHGFVVHEPQHRLAGMFAERFRFKDEIYRYDRRFKPENVRVLISIDMQASKPQEPYHVPVSWIRDYGKGRVFYTNFGHNEATWQDPVFRSHAIQGIGWALARFDAPAAPNPEVQAAESVRSAIPAAAAASGRPADELRARAEAKIAGDAAWAPGLRPLLLDLRFGDRGKALAAFVTEIDKP
ncbi:MAG: ThuA domain-containing protein [Planctomycetia bacterium]|jgi:type 1 glutamine amidotransferase